MNFDFMTASGQYEIERTGSKLTPLGGLIAFASFVQEIGALDRLIEQIPVTRTSPNALPIRDIIVSLMLTILLDGKRFHDVRFIQNDPVVGEAFGVKKRICGDDSIRRLLEEIKPEAIPGIFYEANQYLTKSLPDHYILDWDSTVTTRYGTQGGVEVGYNPTKHGRGSHHPLVGSVAGIRLCLDMEMRAGNVTSADNWTTVLERLMKELPENKRPWLNRADIGFCGEKFLAWHEQSKLHYLFKLKQTARIREAIKKISDDQWEGHGSINALQLKECRIQLMGWSRERRVVLGRRLVSTKSPEESGSLFGESKYMHYAYVTDLPKESFPCRPIADLYDKRADCENIFDELKNQWGFTGFCSQKQSVTDFTARMVLFTYNLWSIFVRFFNISTHEEARNSRREFMLMPARLVKSGREKKVQISVADRFWDRIETGYKRLSNWLIQTAPQLDFNASIANVAIAFRGQISPILIT